MPTRDNSEIEQIRSSKEFAEYAASLSKILAEVLGWSGARAAAHLQSALQNPGFRTYYLHDGPCDEAANLLVRERVGDRVRGLAGVRLRKRIERALAFRGNHYPDHDASYNWDDARLRVERVLKTYDENP